MTRRTMPAFFAGLLTGVILLSTILFFTHRRSFGFFSGNGTQVVGNFSISRSADAVDGWERPEIGNRNKRNFIRYHSSIDSTYYIDTSGFEQLIQAKNSQLRIDLGCNGEENRANHEYHLLFSGWDTLNKVQFFAKLPSSVRIDGLSVGDNAYLDKTCPCPLQGTTCPTCPR